MEWNEVQLALLTATPTSPLELFNVGMPGVYAWWDLQGALSPFWPEGFPEVNVAKPLYVGIAKKTLALRGGEMHLKRTSHWSTIRRSLAALLVDDLDILPGFVVDQRQRAKFDLAPETEHRVTDWMVGNLQVTWVLHPTPADVEKDIIKKLTPPLNYDHATKGPYARPLKVHRGRLLLRAASS
ncbi:GIY-YIG nuclease family protein [Arthrobacter antibioticus]|uniref:GIY-YIG nuclease family protein n=1 Tax=Arthrobacter sp. H35-MC1 TaxID=3046203 RepID=UPI0024BAF425|nr:hypothetical protein [Arthrobacter sp. H35-MC1]MDJ0318356.1 hypothetical protein [Arthrobacter sp. H35-MC1]